MRTTPLLMLSILGGVAHASDWVYVAKAEHVEFLVDTSSIRASGDIRRAWIKHQLAPHTEKAYDGVVQKWETYKLAREAFDCGVGSNRAEALTIYYEDDTYHTLPDSMYPDPWRPVVPETVLNTLLNFVCAWKPTA